MDDPIELLAATPSGDRVFVVTKGASAIHIVDRYRERVSGEIELGRHVAELRMDPLGRYLLARPEGADSTIVIALGTNRVVGTLATDWRADLPFVAPDGGIAAAQGADVSIVDGETLRPVARVRGGAADFWYPFRWTGFRPRAATLDQPVEFAAASDSARAAQDSSAAHGDSVSRAPVVQDSAPRRQAGWTVSFAALLVADKARELAAQIHVGTEKARVTTAMRDGSTIYRVVLGPYATREEAERVGRESRNSYWVYEGGP
jgi:septal ring-binding cell division protein DamX